MFSSSDLVTRVIADNVFGKELEWIPPDFPAVQIWRPKPIMCSCHTFSYEAHFRKFTTLGKISDPIREFYYFFTYFFKSHKVTRVATQNLPNKPKVFQLLHLNWKYNAINYLINPQQLLFRSPPVTFGSNQKSTLIDIRWVKPLASK